jgi:hypothetical protein
MAAEQGTTEDRERVREAVVQAMGPRVHFEPVGSADLGIQSEQGDYDRGWLLLRTSFDPVALPVGPVRYSVSLTGPGGSWKPCDSTTCDADWLAKKLDPESVEQAPKRRGGLFKALITMIALPITLSADLAVGTLSILGGKQPKMVVTARMLHSLSGSGPPPPAGVAEAEACTSEGPCERSWILTTKSQEIEALPTRINAQISWGEGACEGSHRVGWALPSEGSTVSERIAAAFPNGWGRL